MTLDLEKRAGVRRRERRASPIASAAIVAAFGGAAPAVAASQRGVKVPAPFIAVADNWSMDADEQTQFEELRLLTMDVIDADDEQPQPNVDIDVDPSQSIASAQAFVESVRRALPVDEEMDRLAELAFERHASQLQRRKIVRK